MDYMVHQPTTSSSYSCVNTTEREYTHAVMCIELAHSVADQAGVKMVVIYPNYLKENSEITHCFRHTAIPVVKKGIN